MNVNKINLNQRTVAFEGGANVAKRQTFQTVSDVYTSLKPLKERNISESFRQALGNVYKTFFGTIPTSGGQKTAKVVSEPAPTPENIAEAINSVYAKPGGLLGGMLSSAQPPALAEALAPKKTPSADEIVDFFGNLKK